jgi:hypothetical protein
MCRGLEAYNRERPAAFPALRFGMGVHSGAVTLGTIGDPDHFQCAVVGDSVNLASRMEGLTKHFGATLVLSAATRRRIVAPEQFALRPLGAVEVYGRAEEIDVFECVACYSEALQERIMATGEVYADGLAAYRAGRWAEAQERFEACLEACEQDRVAGNFARHCRERGLRGEMWDGVERPGKG